MFFLCVDKPAGYTSHDIVSLFRVLTGIKRIGHTGTLDPFATGVLLLAFQDATKLIGHIPHVPKRYQCMLDLGVQTETADCTGDVVRQVSVSDTVRDTLETVLAQFQGDIVQKPPIYSAIKVNGKRLYEYARKGESVDIPERTVSIYDIQTISEVDGHQPSAQQVALDVRCSKGTYIRSLGCDIAQTLGTVGHLSVLRRLSSDGVDIAKAITLPQLATLVTIEEFTDWRIALSKEGRSVYTRRSREAVLKQLSLFAISPTEVFASVPTVHPTDFESLRLAQGACLNSLKQRLSAPLNKVLWNEQILALLRKDGSILRVNPSIADKRIAAQS